ncbi:hypothetical protein ABZ348_17175 [Streptomyces sp. NPDC005963]|uniref:hypothetical protein n=1 Tax=Streptomyces sp. NPDC005963 TaxID=3156721 RepID=UPI0033EA6FE5
MPPQRKRRTRAELNARREIFEAHRDLILSRHAAGTSRKTIENEYKAGDEWMRATLRRWLVERFGPSLAERLWG